MSQQAGTDQAPNTAMQTFADPSLGVTFDYPADFVWDTSVHTGTNAGRCMTVLLSVHTPDTAQGVWASFALLEFRRSCATDDQWQNHDRLLASLTKALYTQPGAQAIGQPLVYDYGDDLTAQRVHMSAVRESRKDSSGQPLELLLMYMATFVHDRAILWVIQSSDMANFNRLNKTLVSFDGKRKVPLFPATIQPKLAQRP